MFSWAHLGFQVVLYLDEIFSAQDLSELCAHLTISAEARFGALWCQLAPGNTWCFYTAPFFVVPLVNDFFSVKVGISSKDAVNSMRSELLDLPDCWGELKWWRISQETRLQFFSPSSG